MANDSYNLQGSNGGVVIEGTQSFAGSARFVVFDNDTVVDAYTGNIANGDAVYAGKTFKAGQVLGGETTLLTLTSGVATLYSVKAGYTIA